MTESPESAAADSPHGPVSARHSAHGAAREAAREEETLRQRWEATQAALRERFDEPISRATELTHRTLGWFPVRVWRHFLQNNGFLLAAGVSYQALFAIFAAIYVAFAIAGLWLGASPTAVTAVIDLINLYVPGLISEDSPLFKPDQVTQIATGNAGVLSVTGVIALIAVVWTATGWVTFSRRAVRDMFGIPPDLRNYLMLKARDLFAAAVFALALVVGSTLISGGTVAFDLIFSLFGWDTTSAWFKVFVGLAVVVVSFALSSTAIAALFRFLTGTSLRWRRVWPGALLGGAGVTVLQLGAGFLLSYAPANPLLATFAIFVGLLLWFRLMGVVLLVAAAWVALSARDADVELLPQTEDERRVAEHQALLLAAQVRLRTAHEARAEARWFRIWAADRAVRDAEQELAEVEAATPPPPRKR